MPGEGSQNKKRRRGSKDAATPPSPPTSPTTECMDTEAVAAVVSDIVVIDEGVPEPVTATPNACEEKATDEEGRGGGEGTPIASQLKMAVNILQANFGHAR